MTLEGAMLFVIDQAMGGIIRLAQQCAITDDCTVNVQLWSKRTDLSLLRANYVLPSGSRALLSWVM